MGTDSDGNDSSRNGEKSPLAVGKSASTESAKQISNLQIEPDLQEKVVRALKSEIPCDREYKDGQPVRVEIVDSEKLSQFEKKTIRVGFGGVVIAALSLLAASGAAELIFQQFKEMAAQTELLSRAEKQARRDSAEASITAAKQLSIAHQQATAAQQEVSAVSLQMRMDERAWLPIANTNLTSFDSTAGIDFHFDIIDTGKTPARHVEQAIKYVTLKQPVDPIPPELLKGYISRLKFFPKGSVGPNGGTVHVFMDPEDVRRAARLVGPVDLTPFFVQLTIRDS